MAGGNGKSLLSILITTYNRASYLDRCLESIERALALLPGAAGIEVVVLDNGCTDETPHVLDKYRSSLPLKVSREAGNIGFTGGFLKCISLAAGEYCWFLGDDDLLKGDIHDVIDVLKTSRPDIMLLNHCFFTSEGAGLRYVMEDKNFLLRTSRSYYGTYREYILDVRHPNAFFCHIAPIIFRADRWRCHFSPAVLERYRMSHSIHIYVLLSIVRHGGGISFLKEQKIALRVGAPVEWWLTEEGRYERFVMDVRYFTDMFSDVFQDEKLIRHFKDVMLKKSVSVLLLGSKVRCRFTAVFYRRLFNLLYAHYRGHPFFWYGIIPLLLTPRVVFRVLYGLLME